MMEKDKMKDKTKDEIIEAIIHHFIKNKNEHSIKTDIAKGAKKKLPNITHVIDEMAQDEILFKYKGEIVIKGSARNRYNLNLFMDYDIFKNISDIYFKQPDHELKEKFYYSFFREKMTTKIGFMAYICDIRDMDFPPRRFSLIAFLAHIFIDVFEECLYSDDPYFCRGKEERSSEMRLEVGRMFLNKMTFKIMEKSMEHKTRWPLTVDYIVMEYIFEIGSIEKIKLLWGDEAFQKLNTVGTMTISTKGMIENIEDGDIQAYNLISDAKWKDVKDRFSDPPENLLTSYLIEHLKVMKGSIPQGHKELRKAFNKVIRYMGKHPIRIRNGLEKDSFEKDND